MTVSRHPVFSVAIAPEGNGGWHSVPRITDLRGTVHQDLEVGVLAGHGGEQDKVFSVRAESLQQFIVTRAGSAAPARQNQRETEDRSRAEGSTTLAASHGSQANVTRRSSGIHSPGTLVA